MNRRAFLSRLAISAASLTAGVRLGMEAALGSAPAEVVPTALVANINPAWEAAAYEAVVVYHKDALGMLVPEAGVSRGGEGDGPQPLPTRWATYEDAVNNTNPIHPYILEEGHR